MNNRVKLFWMIAAVSLAGLLGAVGLSGEPVYDYQNAERLQASEEGRIDEERAFWAALGNLDLYLRAGVERDVGVGARLLSVYCVNEERALQDTRRLYREKEDLLRGYCSVASDLYGYAFELGGVRPCVVFEGGLETAEGLSAEFEARMEFRDNKWLIAHLRID